jgi:uncharacterized protein DUF6282
MKSVNRDRIVRWLALLIAAAVLVAGHPAGAGLQRSPVGPGDPVARALDGAIDIHVHSFPDNTERSIDALEVSMLSRARGMRGLVLKNHYDPTSGLAYMVRKQVAGLEVFGGVDLNLPVGGMNAAAVEHMAQVSGGYGRVVWMSTFDAENQVRYSKDNRPFVSVSKGGELLPATKDVIAAIAKRGLVLATGHVSAEEGLMLLREGRRVGVAHMVVTHAMNAPILMNVAQMQEATKQGAFIEFAGGAVGGASAAERMDRYADAIRMIGPDFCILSSDLGQKGNPLPPEGFAAFVLELRARGFSDQDLDRMSKVNPARLLGLK